MTAVAAPLKDERMPRASGAGLTWLRDRGMGASILVAAISSAFGVVLLSATGYIAAVLSAAPYLGDSAQLQMILSILTVVFVGVAVYVAGIVTANTFATVVAGRTRRIALMRLIGASARSQRSEIARQGLGVGAIGAVTGVIAGVALTVGGIAVLEALLNIEDVQYSVVQVVLLVPAVIVALTTWAAAWVGSRRVLTVTPLEALGGSVEASHESLTGRKGRNAVAVVIFLIGAALLAAGIALGLITPFGVVVAFFGGLFSFTGLVLGSTMLMPPVLRAVGRVFGRSATARLAAENALRYPERSSRMAIGVVIGVTLVTMFAVALETVKSVIAVSAGGELDTQFTTIIDTFSGIMMGLVAVSAVIAAVGLVNLLTLGVVQRRRELGLLRALGVSTGQVRRMVLLEAAHITITSVITGLVLGTAYGWAGAQSLLGSTPMPPAWQSPTLVAPAVPWLPVALIVAATAILTLVAAVVPTRLATRVAPVQALAD
ncbi:FtsX-like permease family protein [Microbacterium thalassium]|uniref:ABC transporter permease n=2 Tax=Microbacterium TaxID=33882 RepID=UPI0037C58C60